MKLAIRQLTQATELSSVNQLEQIIWGGAEAVPPDHLLASAKNGGMVLGAFDSDRLIGFVYAFPGFGEGRVWLWSYMLGVRPEFRGRGVGEALKLEQRKIALQMGYSLILWSFDPLQSANATLNIRKLGGIARRYEPSYYGEMSDALNAGLRSDRLIVEWWLNSPRVQERLILAGRDHPSAQMIQRASLPVVNPVRYREDGWPESAVPELGRDEAALWLVIPRRFQALKEKDLGLAGDWRYKTATALQHYLGAGYHVGDFGPWDGEGAYRLQKGEPDIEA